MSIEGKVNVLIEMENFLTLLTFLSFTFYCFAFGMAISKLHPNMHRVEILHISNFIYLFTYLLFSSHSYSTNLNWSNDNSNVVREKKGTMSNYPSIDNTLFTRVVLCDYIFYSISEKNFLFLSFSLDWHFFTSTIADEIMCHWDSSEHFLWHWSGKLRMSFTSCFVVGCCWLFFLSFSLSLFMYVCTIYNVNVSGCYVIILSNVCF